MAPSIPPDPPKYVVVTDWGTPHGSLWDIAEDVFEDGSKWRDIYAANETAIGADPGGLRVGMRLLLPPKEVHPAYIRLVAGGLDGEATEIATKLEAAKRRLDAIGNFWGGDDTGTKFFKGAEGKPGYEAAGAQVLAGVGALGDFYKNTAQGLRGMANRDDATEWENTIRVLSTVLQG
ncbi:hypothetical protein GCM10027176_67390 [Actinoallomurus bryophytorum]|uniref:Uncharacterized protein YukE n=1 Tax=Actinoallomurus bryophytorum TaxID=1490222 RepID=A0A543BSJ2_9ACTN|nr:hypothetical protein [Actinoallomurus bryophytorum]TQL87808.1 uncharacterized protein YukE [Actinoallomurus bryophytorum]